MGKIAVHEFTTIDGCIGIPTWTADYPFDTAMGEAIGGIMGSASGILLGRVTYEMFAPAWSTRTADDDPGAPFMNGTHKYVVSGTLEAASWGPATILGGYDPRRIRALKEEVDGDLYVSGSGTLVRAMLNDGLVDELHMFIYPVVIGVGPHLFDHESRSTAYETYAVEHYPSGIIHVAYRPVV